MLRMEICPFPQISCYGHRGVQPIYVAQSGYLNEYTNVVEGSFRNLSFCPCLNAISVVIIHQISAAGKVQLIAGCRVQVIYFDAASFRKSIRNKHSFFFTAFCDSKSIFGNIFHRINLSGYPFSHRVFSRNFSSFCSVSSEQSFLAHEANVRMCLLL